MLYKCVCFDNLESKYNNENTTLKAPLLFYLFQKQYVKSWSEKSKELMIKIEIDDVTVNIFFSCQLPFCLLSFGV